MAYTEAQKRATYKWRAKNIEKVNASQLITVLKAYHKNPEHFRANARKYYHFKKEAERFRNILIE